MSWIPAAGCLVATAVMISYPLNERCMAEIEANITGADADN
jgi:Na+/melibiose symporter-like transporter